MTVIKISIGNENNGILPPMFGITGLLGPIEINDHEGILQKAIRNVHENLQTDMLNGYINTISNALDILMVDQPISLQFIKIFLEKQDFFEVHLESSGYISKITLKNKHDGGFIVFEFL